MKNLGTRARCQGCMGELRSWSRGSRVEVERLEGLEGWEKLGKKVTR